MVSFIQRDFERTEHDDFVLNVQDHLDRDERVEAVEVTVTDGEGEKQMLGWRIQNRYE